MTIASGFIHTAVWDWSYTDVVVISKFLSGYTVVAVSCGVVVF